MNIAMDNAGLLPIIMTAAVVGGVAGYMGSLIVTKKMALVGDALGHVALPGVALALLYGLSVTMGAFVSLALGIVLIWLLENRTTLSTEALTGVIFTASLAVAFILIPEGQIEEALIGDIAKISGAEMFATTVVSILVFVLARKIFPKMILSTLSPDLAKSMKVRVSLYNFLYLSAIGVIVALGIKLVGSLLIGALVIIPAAAARNATQSMTAYSYGGMFLGALSAVIGVYAYAFFGLASGPATVLAAVTFFIITLWKKR